MVVPLHLFCFCKYFRKYFCAFLLGFQYAILHHKYHGLRLLLSMSEVSLFVYEDQILARSE